MRVSSNDSALYFAPTPRRADDPFARLLKTRPGAPVRPKPASDDDD